MKIFRNVSFLLLAIAAFSSIPVLAQQRKLGLPARVMAVDSPRVSRSLIVSMEKRLDDRITRLWEDNPLSVLGSTRGIYLDGYGAVFTVEVNPAVQPLTLMNPVLTPADKTNFPQEEAGAHSSVEESTHVGAGRYGRFARSGGCQ